VTTGTLADFLLARIDEDENLAGAFTDEERILAWCAAHRRIVDWAGAGWQPPAIYELLQLLALPYADHPDYLPEWAI
jgi:hypothetical protein